jgi:hypothetical protein
MRRPNSSWTRLTLLAVFLAVVCLPSAAQTVSDPAWGFSFSLPAGWKVQKDANGAILGHDSIAGMILVFPHTAASMEEMRGQMEAGFNEQDFQLGISGALKPLGKGALAVECTGYADGQEVKGRALGALSPYGGGAYVVAITTPAMYGKELAAAADRIVQGMQFPKTDTAGLLRVLAGTWVTMSSNTQSQFTLGPDGRFSEYSESTYGGSSSDQYGNDTGSWGVGGSAQGAGRWTARGTKESGTITFTYTDGRTSTYPYTVHVENGQTYWNEFYFGGVLYGRSQ